MSNLIPALIVLLIFSFWRNIVWEIRAVRDDLNHPGDSASDGHAYAWQRAAFIGFYITILLCFLEAWT